MSAVWRWLVRTYHSIVDATPGGALGLLVVIVAVAALALVVAQRRGLYGRRRGGGETGIELPAQRSADAFRTQADAFAARGAFAEAVRARLRATVATLEDRGVLDPRPGRTAAEVAAEAGAARNDLRDLLWRGALTFGEIWYGRRVATAADDRVLADLDEAVRHRPRPPETAPPLGATMPPAAPR